MNNKNKLSDTFFLSIFLVFVVWPGILYMIWRMDPLTAIFSFLIGIAMFIPGRMSYVMMGAIGIASIFSSYVV